MRTDKPDAYVLDHPMNSDCQLVPHASGKAYCPACDPEGRKLLPAGVRRNCQTPEAKAALAEALAQSDDEGEYLFPGPYIRYREPLSVRERIEREAAGPLREDPSPLILVVGLHCSLSSCLAGVLARLGVWMGKGAVGGEDPKFAALLESLMPFPGTDLKMYADKACTRVRLFRELIEHYLIRDAAAANKPAGVKYPTLCRFAGELFTKEAWPNLRIIHIARPLSESIASLTDRSRAHVDPRYRATPEECDRLQRELWSYKQQFLSSRPHLTVSADDLLRQPAGEVDRLVEYLRGTGLSPSDDQRRQAIAHVDARKARHSVSLRDPEPWIAETTIAVKTHRRAAKLGRLPDSIRARYPATRVLVADDGRSCGEPIDVPGVAIHRLPFDVGLSAGRNWLVDQVDTPYVLLCDDDFRFTAETNIDALHRALTLHDFDLVAGDARSAGRPPLVGHFELAGNRLILKRGPKSKIAPGVFAADWAPNFFLGKVEALKRCRWDDRLKVGEHQDFFLRAWRLGLKIGYVPECVVEDENAAGDSSDYRVQRRRDRTFYRDAMARWARRLAITRYEASTHRLDFTGPAMPLPTIPKNIHQIWIGPNRLPERFAKWVDGWRSKNPDWTHRLWSEGEAMPLLWPDLEPLYHRATSWAQKSDFLRLAILYYHGGVYLDTDFEPLSPLSQEPLGGLVDGIEAFVSVAARDGQLCNGVLGATAQHPLIGELLRAIPRHFDPNVGSSIGPRMVMAVMRQRNPDLVDQVAVFPQHYFLPIQYTEREKLKSFSIDDWPHSYAVHHFAASWQQ